MTAGLTLARCRACAAEYFPAPLMCARCGRRSFRARPAAGGHVEECVRLNRSGGPPAAPTVTHLATVRVGDVPVVAGLEEAVERGAWVELGLRDGAPVGVHPRGATQAEGD